MAVMHLQQFAKTGNEHFMMLQGPIVSGKTVLLQAGCQEAQHFGQDAVYLSLAHYTHYQPEWLADLHKHHLICLDDIDAIVGNSHWEPALFYLFNAMRDDRKYLLFATTSRLTFSFKVVFIIIITAFL